jgi:hypothetical protein
MVRKLEQCMFVGFLLLSALCYAVAVKEALGIFPTAVALCSGDFCPVPMSDFSIAA